MAIETTRRARKNGGGFLPIRTNLLDRIFIGVVIFVAIHLFWMRFLEAYISLYAATAISLIVGWIIVRRG
jgi:predicted small integral membrane protein